MAAGGGGASECARGVAREPHPPHPRAAEKKLLKHTQKKNKKECLACGRVLVTLHPRGALTENPRTMPGANEHAIEGQIACELSGCVQRDVRKAQVKKRATGGGAPSGRRWRAAGGGASFFF